MARGRQLRLPHTDVWDAHVHIHALTCTLGSTCHVLFGRLSPAGEPHFQVPESKQQQERRVRRERTVRQAGGPLGDWPEWLRAPVEPPAEGGGGEGSDFLALGGLLGVGWSDYRGAGTGPAGTGIMRCLPKRRLSLIHI